MKNPIFTQTFPDPLHQRPKAGPEKRKAAAALILAAALAVSALLCHSGLAAGNLGTPTRIPVIIVGDRLVDLAYHLGVIPEAMSVRCSSWPLSRELKIAVEALGCPVRAAANPEFLVEAAKRRGVSRVVMEASANACTSQAELSTKKLGEAFAAKGLKVEFVDFSKGVSPAVTRAAEIFGVSGKAAAVIAKYEKDSARLKSAIPTRPVGKKVLVVHGVYMEDTGKAFLQVEASKGYTDKYLLGPLGCVNVGDRMFKAGVKAEKGFYTLRTLDAISEANPDVIVFTGDSYAGQAALAQAVKKNPALGKVPAVKNLAVYSLPEYINANSLDYPLILLKWAKAVS